MDNFEVFCGSEDIPVVLSCEHASKHIPEELNNLGVSVDELNNCSFLCDRGADEAFEFLVSKLGCNGIKAKVSRLVVDVNRDLDQKDLIRESCNGLLLKGNQGLTEEERKERIDKYYVSYRNKLHDLLNECHEKFGFCLYFLIHTMENCFENERREMDFAIIYNEGEKLAKDLGKILEEMGHDVSYNHPYTLEKGVIRVTHDSEVTKFNECAVVVEINDKFSGNQDIRESLLEAIKIVVGDYSSQK